MIRFILGTILCVAATTWSKQTGQIFQDPLITLFKKQELHLQAVEKMMLERFNQMQSKMDQQTNTMMTKLETAEKKSEAAVKKMEDAVKDVDVKINNKIDITTNGLSDILNKVSKQGEENQKAVSDVIKLTNAVKQDLTKQSQQLSSVKSGLDQRINVLETSLQKTHQDILAHMTKCKSGYSKTQYGYSCYKASVEETDWEDAKIKCAADGAHLVALETSAETQAVNKWMKGNRVTGTHWTGGNDRSTRGRWVWDGPGVALTYTDWYPGAGNDGGNFNCIDMHPSYQWNDSPCKFNRRYICEI